MQSDVELILKRVQEMKAREDMQRQLRLETLKRNNEFNLQPKSKTVSQEPATDNAGL
jgi:hypothetical protein